MIKSTETFNNPINQFDFDSRKCRLVEPKLTKRTQAVLENKKVMLRGLHTFCMACRMCSLGCTLLNEKGKEFDPHVFSNMRHDSKFMVIGQNPGFDECQIGTPFIGQAGRNFDDELKKNNLHRKMFYITNIVKCHTLKNDKPEQKHVALCSKILEIEIAAIRPTLIITLGSSSFDFFCPEIKYSEGLGTISKSAYGNVFAIYHPSPLNINNPERREKFNNQMRLLGKLVKALRK